jgi:Putative Actinobacterial Holin-X, holin superfamily III
MSTERADLPEEEEARTWADRATGLAASAQALLSTRLAIFREEISVKAALVGRGLAATALAVALGVGALLLLAALLAAIFANLFGSVSLGILAATLIYAAGAGFAGLFAWKALSRVRPDEFPATGRELERDWQAIRDALAAEPEDEATAEASGPEPDEAEVEHLEARLRGGGD